MGLQTTENPRVHLGANHPPTEAAKPDPFGALVAHFDSLKEETANWLDGAAIETDGQASKVQELLRMWQEAEKAADDARVAENAPFDDGKAKVQERYAPLIANTKKQTGLSVRAIAACKSALTTWMRAQEAKRQAEAARLALEAATAAAAAQKAVQDAQQAADFGAMETAEQTIAEARDAANAARHVETATTKVVGMGRAIGLRDNWVSSLDDPLIALKHYMATDPDSVKAWLLARIQQDVRSGKRTIPGAVIENQPVAA